MKRILLLLAIVTGFTSVNAQNWNNVAGRWNYQWLRGDSTLFFATFCGAPVGTAGLHGAKFKRMSAIYYDSCAATMYVFNPKDSSWAKVGRATQINDTSFVVGLDTIRIHTAGGVAVNIYTSDGTTATDRTITQAGMYLRFKQSNINYTQFNGALQTIQPDSAVVPFYTKIIKSPYAGTPADGMVEWREGLGFGDQSPGRPNYPFMRGWNLAPGGSAYISGLPAFGESWEPHYLPDGTSPTLWLMEMHKYFITRLGVQMRLESWTINTRDNDYSVYYKVPSVSWRDSLESDYMSATTAYRGDKTTVFSLRSGNGTTETQLIAGGTEDVTEIRSVSNGQLNFTNWNEIGFGNGNGYNVADNMWGIGQVSQGFNIVRATHPWGLHYKNSAAAADAAAFTVDGNTGEVQNYVSAGGYFATYYSNGSERMRLSTSGNLLIGTTTDNSIGKLQVNGKATVATIDSTATPNNLIYQEPGTGELKKTAYPILKGSTTWTPGVVAAGSSATTTFTLTGAALGDPVTVSKASGAYSNGEVYDAFVSAVNTVTVRVHNVSTGSANYSTSETYKCVLLKY